MKGFRSKVGPGKALYKKAVEPKAAPVPHVHEEEEELEVQEEDLAFYEEHAAFTSGFLDR